MFEPGDDLSDDSSEGSDEDGDKKKVKWDAGVVDKRRQSLLKNRQATMIQMQMKRDEIAKSGGNVGLLSNNLRQTKINFDLPDFNHLYKGMETEKVWIDFGKANTNVKRYNPMTCES